MQVEDRLSTLPMRTRYELKSQKVLHVIPNLGLIRVKSGVTYGVGTLADLGVSPVATFETQPRNTYSVVSILMGVRERTGNLSRVAPVGYCLLSDTGDIVTVSISDISRYMDRIVNIAKSSQKGILGLELDVTTPCNILYINLQDEKYEETQGYRLKDGKIKRLLSRQVTSPYLAVMSNKDLTDIAASLNDVYFQGRLSDISVEWKYGGIAHTRVHPMPSSANDVNAGIAGHKAMMGLIRLSRPFLLDQPQLFYEVLLHEMIHALGTPDSHNTFFQRWVGIIKGFEPDLEIATAAYTRLPEMPKWALSEKYISEENKEYTQFVCPACGNIMYAASNNIYRCKCGNSVQFSA